MYIYLYIYTYKYIYIYILYIYIYIYFGKNGKCFWLWQRSLLAANLPLYLSFVSIFMVKNIILHVSQEL